MSQVGPLLLQLSAHLIHLGLIEATIFEENLRFRQKFRIWEKISDFGENLRFRRKSRNLEKILDFDENLGRSFR